MSISSKPSRVRTGRRLSNRLWISSEAHIPIRRQNIEQGKALLRGVRGPLKHEPEGVLFFNLAGLLDTQSGARKGDEAEGSRGAPSRRATMGLGCR